MHTKKERKDRNDEATQENSKERGKGDGNRTEMETGKRKQEGMCMCLFEFAHVLTEILRWE